MDPGILGKAEIEAASKASPPLITNTDDPECFQPASYDLRIGTAFWRGQVINSSHDKANEQFIIQPGEIVSILTLEELTLPNDMIATAFAINQQSREGLMVLNPGHVDPGYRGPLTVKAMNMQKVPLAISIGDRIFTVIFQRLPKPTEPYRTTESREKREKTLNKIDVEKAPKGLSEILTIHEECPFTTKGEVQDIVIKHWMSWATMILAVLAVIIAALAIVLTWSSSRDTAKSGVQERAAITVTLEG